MNLPMVYFMSFRCTYCGRILSRISFSIYVAVYARRVKVTGGNKSHLALGTIRYTLKPVAVETRCGFHAEMLLTNGAIVLDHLFVLSV